MIVVMIVLPNGHPVPGGFVPDARLEPRSACVIPLGLPSNGRIDSLRRGNICIATVCVAARQLSHSAIVEGFREARVELNRSIIVLYGVVVLSFPKISTAPTVESLSIFRLKLNCFIVVLDSAVVLAFFRVRNTSVIESFGLVRF